MGESSAISDVRSITGILGRILLASVRAVPEVCRIFCATANPAEVVVAETGQGRSILGVVDGFAPLGIENDDEIVARKALLREFGYKA